MAKSTVTITFTGVPVVSDYLQILNSLAPAVGNIQEQFVSLRQQSEQVTIGSTNTTTAANYYNAIIADKGNSGLYTFNISGDIVVITATVSNVVFSLGTVIGTDFSVLIDNQTEAVPIAISSATFSTDVSNACGKIIVNVTTNVLATSYYIDGVFTANSLNPFTYSANRGQTHLLQVTDGTTTANKYITAPIVLASSNITVNILNTPNGATLTILLYDDTGITPEYSLDDITYQSSNIFTGILPGIYTIYVKDQFGCLVFKDFNVPVFSPNVLTVCPVSYISESMSIRFKHDIQWDNVDVYKTDFNTLACEEQVLVPYAYKQMFKTSNMVTTQLLSNYQNIAVNIIREDQSKISVPIKLQNKFVDLKDRRDARLKYVSPTKSGIYYTSGNTYDYTTGAIIGSYALNGALPDYASVGNYVNIDGVGWFLIEDIVYDEVLNVDMLLITFTATAPDAAEIVFSNWNQKNYNVLEFDIDFGPFLDEYLQVEILQSSPGFADFNWLSEFIEVRESYRGALEFIWFNYEDSNVFYSTGIKNIGNYSFMSFKTVNDSDVVINKTTNNSVMVNASNYDAKELVIEDLPTGIVKQLTQAVLHKGLLINRVPYVASSSPTLELVENTNLHSLTLTLLSTNPPYLSCQPSGAPSPV